MDIDENDTQFRDWTIKTVAASDGAWVCDLVEGSTISIPDAECHIAPTVGETVRLYGAGIGYVIRGAVIGERVYFYRARTAREVLTDSAVDALKALRNEARKRGRREDVGVYEAVMGLLEQRRHS